MLRSALSSLAVTAVVAATLVPAPARAWDRGRTDRFALLPEGTGGPEGLEVDRRGRVYVGIFGSATGAGEIIVLDEDGRKPRRLLLPEASPNLLGLRFQPGTGTLLVVDFGAAQVLAVDPRTGASEPFVTLPPDRVAGAGLNDLEFDRAGNVYVSDSFQGIVWRAGPDGGEATAWLEDPLFRTQGVPPFGANGLRFDRGETALYVANTGEDTVVRVPVASGGAGAEPAGAAAVFAHSVNGADGLLVDPHGNVWVAANQADEIVVIDPSGKAIAKLGDFDGIDRKGAVEGLLFPASLRFHDGKLLVTNLALDLRTVDPTFSTPDSAWAAKVARHSVAVIRAGRGRER